MSVDIWLDTALEELRVAGYSALKAQPLAKKLGVTRGSFYYHFDSLAQFHAAVIHRWSQRTTGPVMETVGAEANPAAALRRLLQVTLRSGEALERAVRSWATVNDTVAQAVEGVDCARIEVAEALLTAQGLPQQDAEARARMLYWAAIGRLMMPFPDRNTLTDDQIDRLAALMSAETLD